MSNVFTEGFDDFEDLLIQISDEFGYKQSARNVLVPAVKTAMEAIVPIAKGLAHVRTGKMRDSIRVDGRIPNQKDKKSYYYSEGDAALGVVSVKQSKVSLGEEFGTANKAGKPFLRPALESNQELVLRRLSTVLAYRLEHYRAKKSKGKKS